MKLWRQGVTDSYSHHSPEQAEPTSQLLSQELFLTIFFVAIDFYEIIKHVIWVGGSELGLYH